MNTTEVYTFIKEHGNVTVMEIANHFDKIPSNVKKIINRLVEFGDVCRHDSGDRVTYSAKNNERLGQDKINNFLSQLNRKLDTWLNSFEGEDHEHRELLAQVPNVFSLLCKLANNDVISERSKSKLTKAITYFIHEFDLMPEAIIGPLGFLDDLVISALAIMYVMDNDSRDIVRDSWEGNEDIIALIAEIINNADDFVGQEIHRQLIRKIE